MVSGLSLRYKITHSTSGIVPIINELRVPFVPIREEFSYSSANKGVGTALVTLGVGTEARTYLTLEEADAVAVINGTFLVISQNYTLTANTVLASHVLRIPGGSFTKASTYTLTFSGSFENLDNGHCFIGFDAGDVTFWAGTVDFVCPEWWEIDGVNDDIPINKAIYSLPADTGLYGLPAITDPSYGGIVKLSRKYRTTNPVITWEGIWLEGTSRHSARIVNDNTGGLDAIQVINGPNAIQYPRWNGGIKHLTIQGNASSGVGLRLKATALPTSGSVYSPSNMVFEDLYIASHGGNGIQIDPTTVGGTFRDVHSESNSGWGLMNGKVSDTVRTNTTQRFYSCQFRSNTLGGAYLFRAIATSMNGCIFESNVGVGLQVASWNNFFNYCYFEGNDSGNAFTTNILITGALGQTAAGNIFFETYVDGGKVSFVSANINQWVMGQAAIVQFDASSHNNEVVHPALFSLDTTFTDAGSNYYFGRKKVTTTELGGNVPGAIITTTHVKPGITNTFIIGKDPAITGDGPSGYKELVLKDTMDGKHYKITVINGVITATALD